MMITDGLAKVGSKNVLNQASKKPLVIVSLYVIGAISAPFMRPATKDIRWYLLPETLPFIN